MTSNAISYMDGRVHVVTVPSEVQTWISAYQEGKHKHGLSSSRNLSDQFLLELNKFTYLGWAGWLRSSSYRTQSEIDMHLQRFLMHFLLVNVKFSTHKVRDLCGFECKLVGKFRISRIYSVYMICNLCKFIDVFFFLHIYAIVESSASPGNYWFSKRVKTQNIQSERITFYCT